MTTHGQHERPETVLDRGQLPELVHVVALPEDLLQKFFGVKARFIPDRFAPSVSSLTYEWSSLESFGYRYWNYDGEFCRS